MRDERMIEIHGNFAETRVQPFYIGTVHGSPVGENPVAKRLTAAMAKDKTVGAEEG